MDEGKAALYAAIIGFAAAIIGAAAGGWASWKAARHGADAAVRAVVEQVHGQARNEETQWIRQERRQLYSKVVTTRTDFEAALQTWEDTPGPLDSPLYTDAVNAWRRLVEACREVEVFGPDDVAQAASAIGATAGEVMTSTIAQAGVNAGENDPELLGSAATADYWKGVLLIAQANFTRAARSTFTGDLPRPPAG
ncbi:hypothetical protein ACH4Q6_17205 [Streptomyces lydicus]|uniref:hypothetical protein n=1 Tax=Streptomyces lydicus TaxID=47763 RepID=UPI00379D4BD2